MRNASKTNNVGLHGPCVSFNYYKMPDSEIKKMVEWLNKNRCPNAPRRSLQEIKMNAELARLKLEQKERFGKK